MPKKYFLAALGLVLSSAALTTDVEAQMYPYREDTGKEMPDRATLTELAKTLQNPIANLIQIPLVSNFDFGQGDSSGFRYNLGINPIIPTSITSRVMMISKTELNVVAQNDFGGTSPYQQGGLGDTQQSFFFTPRNAGKKFMFGAGPVFRLPTATDRVLGSEKWSIGPTAVALSQIGPWTFGVLSNYLISFAGEDDRPRVNQLLLQPFAAVVVGNAWAINLSTETTYNFTGNKWNAPLIGGVTKVVNIGQMTWGFGGQMKVAMANPNNQPDWGFRTTASILFPGRELATKAVARTVTASNTQKKSPADGLPQVVQSALQASQTFRY